MKKLARVAVTGLGAVCGLGDKGSEIWEALVLGENGITPFSEEERVKKKLPITYAGRVKNFHIPEEILSLKDQERFDRFIHFALKASGEALDDSGLERGYYPSHRVGSILGVGMGGFPYIEKYHQTFMERGGRRVSPFFIPSIIPNMATGLSSINFGFQGTNYTVSSACASSGHALANAAMEIQLGHQDMVISGGAEAVITGFTSTGFFNMKALSKSPDYKSASRPFDKGRDGFVMGEGAGILILENYEKAKRRGARIYAELVSYASNSDSHHITAPQPEGLGASQCMSLALERGKISPEQIQYINAHGTSTPLGDLAETKAIKSVFGPHAEKLQVSSTKSSTGHLLGAAAGLESFFCVKVLEKQVTPPTINLHNPDPECDLDYTPHISRKGDYEYVLNNSFGFGGTNSSIIFKKEV